MSESNSQSLMDNIVKIYLENVTNNIDGDLELEVRFGTKGIKKISKIDFDNAYQKLLSSGFNVKSSDNYSLKMKSEFIDKKTGQTKLSNVRVEVPGMNFITQYCKTDSLANIPALFVQKKSFFQNDKPVYPVDINDFNFRISLAQEKTISPSSSFANNIIASWGESKKEYRYLNRTSLSHPKMPIRVDISITKMSNRQKEYNIEASQVFQNIEHYEIELELINKEIGPGTEYTTVESIVKEIKKVVKIILSGLQQTNFPISYSKMKNIGVDYLKLVFQKEYTEKMQMYSRNFLGPQSVTLQIENIAPINEDAISPNIRKKYTVTEKADGLRKLLFINKDGNIYLIDTNMNIQFTGVTIKNPDLLNTLLDGEHILHNKKGQFINLYAAFDIYILDKKDVRVYPFIPPQDNEKQQLLTKFRLPLLVNVIQSINVEFTKSEKKIPIRIENKNFKAENVDQTIFNCCSTILHQHHQGLYEYEIDGLIFTPADLGVGASNIGEVGPKKKTTWIESFKWKPPEFNTIDFLVTTKKTPTGQDYIGNVFQNGTDASAYDQLTQFKTLILRVGFNESQDGYINPCGDVIEGKLPSYTDDEPKRGQLKPVPFMPTNPSDPEAQFCNIILKTDDLGNKRLFTEEDEVFDDQMIVEFKYDFTKEKNWRWVPIRVRYDKTAEFKKGEPNFGNAYRVANNNWHSIHNPITEEMLSTGENIPDQLADDDIYYNRLTKTNLTVGLRDFHNLFVKNTLIKSISKRGNTLIDYAVGKGGDFPKWIAAKLSFVFGIDLSPDNIENRLNGACARYLNYRKSFKNMPSALFVVGNSSYNIKDGSALNTEKGKQITKAVFGEGPKERKTLGEGVYKEYGKGSNGFNISSCQFALHYFFENKRTLNSFIRNVSECTEVDGYFVGGCYNGEKIFNSIKSLTLNESVSIMDKDKKLWQITKKYTTNEFNDDETSLGLAIDVYQESINKTATEFLVNFNYLNRIMENYGFVMLNRDECKEIGIPESVGSFQELYGLMEDQITKNSKLAKDYGEAPYMNAKEKQISFYNNYFIYKKIRNVDASAIERAALGVSTLQQDLDVEESKETQEEFKEIEKEIKPKAKKLKKKLKLTTE